jgi:ketosteroid isomerase-like protein
MLRRILLAALAYGALTAGAAAQAPARADGRDADRAAIRAHIESIFKAYVERDCKTIRATHAEDWIGFTGQARSIVRGIEAYMNNSAGFCRGQTPAPAPEDGGLADYKLTEIDYVFYGDTALVPYVAETWYGRKSRVPGKLRSIDIYAKLNGEWTQVGSNIYAHPDMVRSQVERQTSQPRQLPPEERRALLAAREAVWRAWFSGDRAHLEKVIPEETVAVNAGGGEWQGRAAILDGARQFAETGAKLVRLEFPRTDIQLYGNTAVLYTTYLFETEKDGKRTAQAGRGTEIFVLRNNTWVNTGWHLDDGN